jgi:hypothetical protein
MTRSLCHFVKQACAFLLSACIIVTTLPLSASAQSFPRQSSPKIYWNSWLPPSIPDSPSRASSSVLLAGPAVPESGAGSAVGNRELPPLVHLLKESRSAPFSAVPNSKVRLSQVSRRSNELAFVENKGQFDRKVKFQVANGQQA